MKYYIVITNSVGCEIASFEVDGKKPIASELVRIIKEEYIFLCEGDKIEFISK